MKAVKITDGRNAAALRRGIESSVRKMRTVSKLDGLGLFEVSRFQLLKHDSRNFSSSASSRPLVRSASRSSRSLNGGRGKVGFELALMGINEEPDLILAGT
jgi:hypothetical protein